MNSLKQLSFLENETHIIESDEWYTFPNTVKAIKKYLKPNSKILCPFSFKESNFVKVLKEKGHKITYSHITKDNIKNFFDYSKNDVKSFDYIIDNPLFSKRNEIFNKLFELEVPFMMLVPLVSITKKSLRDWIDQLELLFFPRRQNFFNSYGKKQGSPYDTIFVCWPGPKLEREREREREKKNSSFSINNEWLLWNRRKLICKN